MIPQRVAIEGFLSYRRQVVFSFDGAPIWMLTGKNGAGKSSVFDAITFALYGVHRGGKSEAKELINRNSDRLAVQFDFMLGEDCYRVERTVARKGNPTFQAWHLNGPNPPTSRRKGEQAIDRTDSKDGLNKWVKDKLGLDDEAFKMSALLEQGKSDALLSAKPADRHELLSRLVDLRRYQALKEEADQREKDENSVVKANRAELVNLAPVTPAQLVEQEERVTQSKRQTDRIRRRLEQLQALMVHAQEWSKLGRRRDDALTRLATMRALLADADAIEAAALRLGDLQSTLPALSRILQHRQ
jgi:DNA repair exonuclease SbcCD ATPase subunit